MNAASVLSEKSVVNLIKKLSAVMAVSAVFQSLALVVVLPPIGIVADVDIAITFWGDVRSHLTPWRVTTGILSSYYPFK